MATFLREADSGTGEPMGSPLLGFQRGELRAVSLQDPGQMLPCQCLRNTKGGLTGQHSLVPAALCWIYRRLPKPTSSFSSFAGVLGSVDSPSTWGHYKTL